MKSRRQFVKNTAAGVGVLSLSTLLHANDVTGNNGKKKIVCLGGHPDDPESGCGGTLAKMIKKGHAVTIIYLKTGEAGVKGKSHEEAAAIRKQEALNACAILSAKPVFAGQIDGDTVVDNAWLNKIVKLLSDENPDVVLTHWPIDSHKDHQVASLLTTQAWVKTQKKFALYFFEVCAGEQSLGFHPTDYVDITDTQGVKKTSNLLSSKSRPCWYL
ncbi:MAG: PIG-L deacetylase family protein [Segetibacter sp.]